MASTDIAAAPSPAIWLRPPAWSTAAVLDELPATDRPPSKRTPVAAGGEQLLIGPDLVSSRRRRTACGTQPLSQPTKANAAPATATSKSLSGEPAARAAEGRPVWNVSRDRHAPNPEVEDARTEQSGDQHQQRPRQSRKQSRPDEQDRQGSRSNARGQQISLTPTGEQANDPAGPHREAPTGMPSMLGSSPRITRTVRPITNAGDDRLRQKLRDPTDPKPGREHQHRCRPESSGRGESTG